MPIMLKSSICVLKQYNHLSPEITGECSMDGGGYFIINGSEKTCLGQERAAENNIMCFCIKKNNNKWSWLSEVKSIPDDKCISPKQINLTIATKNNGSGHPMYINIPRIKNPIPIITVFRALGILSDKEICQIILLDIDTEDNKPLLYALKASILNSQKIDTQEDAINFVTSQCNVYSD